MKFASYSFESTNSPCLDAIIINIDFNCKDFYFDEDNNVGKIRCLVPRKDYYNFWTTTSFSVYSIASESVPEDNQIMYCVDPYIFIIAEKR